jgi:hypothetical protein
VSFGKETVRDHSRAAIKPSIIREPNQLCPTLLQVIPIFGRFGAETDAHFAASFGAEVGQPEAS